MIWFDQQSNEPVVIDQLAIGKLLMIIYVHQYDIFGTQVLFKRNWFVRLFVECTFTFERNN